MNCGLDIVMATHDLLKYIYLLLYNATCNSIDFSAFRVYPLVGLEIQTVFLQDSIKTCGCAVYTEQLMFMYVTENDLQPEQTPVVKLKITEHLQGSAHLTLLSMQMCNGCPHVLFMINKKKRSDFPPLTQKQKLMFFILNWLCVT